MTRLVPQAQDAAPATSAVAELRVFRDRGVQLAILITAVGNAGLLMFFTYISPLLTDVTGFSAGSVTALLLVYGVGATAGNFVGGRLSDRALMPSQVGLLTVLGAGLLLTWATSSSAVATAVMVFLIGAMGFAVVPGMQTRVLDTAASAPTLAIAVNASAYQLAAAFAAWLGGRVIDGAGLRSVYVTAAAVTAAGALVNCYAWYRDHAVTVRARAAPSGTSSR